MDFDGGKIRKIIVLGGGSAGFLTALALKTKIPEIDVIVIRSRDIGIIGVGEGSTVAMYQHLHGYLGIRFQKFLEIAQPTWKLGLKFLWGRRPHFYYTFGPGLEALAEGTLSPVGSFCRTQEDIDYSDNVAALMSHDRVFPRAHNGQPLFHPALSYHFENEKFVNFLEQYAKVRQIQIIDDTVKHVKRDESGIGGVELDCGRIETADLYVDASGFRSLLLSQTMAEPFVSYGSSLFCDRAVVGGWPRTSEPIHPYTTCETMDSGWCWQIEHEQRINRGYVYCSAFISDEQAQREFRAVAPKVEQTRIIRFVCGRYERGWVGNVVAIGNASGFVEPLEATALGVIALQSQMLVGALREGDMQIRQSQVNQYNRYHQRSWDAIRGFIAVHYKFNQRRDTDFWKHCREATDLASAAPIVEHYIDSGPGGFWQNTLFDPLDQFKMAGYAALLVGQQVPVRQPRQPGDAELRQWEALRRRYREQAVSALTIPEALKIMRSPDYQWD